MNTNAYCGYPSRMPVIAKRRGPWRGLHTRNLRIESLETRAMLNGIGVADPVLFWNDVTLDAALVDSRASAPAQGGPTLTSRAMAIVHAAIYDAWNGVHREFEPYLVETLAPNGASGEAAVAKAAHDVLVALYPAQKRMFDRELENYLDDIRNGRAERLGVQYGHFVADQILDARANDGSDAPMPYMPGTEPGDHQVDPTNPNQGFLTPGWGAVDPFVIPSPDQFDAPAFPALTSAEYTAAFEEVRVVGALDAEVSDRNGDGLPDRTDEQTEIGIYWGYDQGLGTPPRLYNQIVRDVAIQQHNTVSENARLFALTNFVMADAGIASWDTKYEQNIWRPIVAIREAATDGNPDTIADANWVPLGAPLNVGRRTDNPGRPGPDANPDPRSFPGFTPPFPAYTSGHATFGGAVFETLANFYGTDAMTFTFRSDDSRTTRTFTSFSQAALENAVSRIYLGIHWRPDALQGIAQGTAIAEYAWANALEPLPGLAAANVLA